MVWLTLLAATITIPALLLLPGFGVMRLLKSQTTYGLAPLVIAISWSVVLIAVLSTPLLVFGVYHPFLILVPLLILGIIGIPAAISRVNSHIWLVVAVCMFLALPWAKIAVEDGFPPGGRLQWHYSDTGRIMTAERGIPGSVSEYGAQVRWQPDYVFFNSISELYRNSLFFLDDTMKLVTWRYPVAALGYLAMFLILRLWVRPIFAYLGLLLLSLTWFFPRVFDVYKPEAIGIIVGLLSSWLVIVGVRLQRRELVLLGGAVIGVNIGIHAIAAVAFGVLAVAGGFTEWAYRKRDRLQSMGVLAISASLALVIAASTGLLLQGRAFVVSDAFQPTRVVNEDPTWIYLERSGGRFHQEGPPDRWEQLSQNIPRRLEGVVVSEYPLLLLVVLAGVGGAIFSKWKLRNGIATLSICLALLIIAIGFFVLNFETYVPRHTGSARLLSYLGMYLTLCTVLAVDGITSIFQRRLIPAYQPDVLKNVTYGVFSFVRRRPIAIYLCHLLFHKSTLGFMYVLLVAVILITTANLVNNRFSSFWGIEPTGLEALDVLAEIGGKNDVVLSNVVPAGLVTFRTGKEHLLEGRQPLIEEAGLLNKANQLLLDTHRFFTRQADGTILWENSVQWVVVANHPRLLGGGPSLGGTVEELVGHPNLNMVWRREGIAIFEVTSEQDRQDPLEYGLRFSQSLHNALEQHAVAVWNFDEGSGTTAIDSSGSGNHGTITGATYQCDDTPFHLVGKGEAHCALQFDGRSEVEIQDVDSLNITDSVTVSAWIRITGDASNQFQRITDKGETLVLWIQDSGEGICVRLNGTMKHTRGSQVCFYLKLQVDRWHHLAFSYGKDDEDRLKLYLNGFLVGTDNQYYGDLGTNDANFMIGNRTDGDRPFKGLIDDVSIYSGTVPESVQKGYILTQRGGSAPGTAVLRNSSCRQSNLGLARIPVCIAMASNAR